MSISLRHAKTEDVPSMAALDVEAFADTAMHKAMFPERLRIKPGLQDNVEWNTVRMNRGLEDPSTHHIVAVDTAADGQETVVGCAEWNTPSKVPEPEAAEKTPEEQAKATQEQLAKLPSCIDKDALLGARDEITSLLKSSGPAFQGRKRRDMWSESHADQLDSFSDGRLKAC